MQISRFPDAAVMAAVAERAIVTTLATSEGRTLTEVSLWLRNRAQAFLKVVLPAGATMVSAEVAGGQVKPAQAADGTRVPLSRPGFRRSGPYKVSFVYLQAGQPLGKRGKTQLTLPRMDVPILMVEWELFLPGEYRVKKFTGSAMPDAVFQQLAGQDVADALVPMPPGYGRGSGTGIGTGHGAGLGPGSGGGTAGGKYEVPGGVTGGVVGGLPAPAAPPAIAGRAADASGQPLPGVRITVESSDSARHTAVTDASGHYTLSGVPAGPIVVTSELAGFAPTRESLILDDGNREVNLTISAGSMSETVVVSGEAPVVSKQDKDERERRTNEGQQIASSNVLNLQRRVEGVFPVRMDVPRAGSLHRFVRPLVVDEETTVAFEYRRR